MTTPVAAQSIPEPASLRERGALGKVLDTVRRVPIIPLVILLVLLCLLYTSDAADE